MQIDTQVQTLVGILIVVTALVLQAQLKPYDAKTLDHLETAGLGVSAFTLCVALRCRALCAACRRRHLRVRDLLLLHCCTCRYGGLFLFHAGIPTAAKIVITITIAVANVGFLVRCHTATCLTPACVLRCVLRRGWVVLTGCLAILSQLYGVILIFKQIKQRAAVLCGKLGRSRACGCCARRCCPRITRGSPGDSNVHLFTRHSSSQVVPDAVLAPNGAVIVDPVTGPESSSGRGAGAKPVPVRGNESPTRSVCRRLVRATRLCCAVARPLPTGYCADPHVVRVVVLCWFSPWRTAVIGRSKDMLGSADDLAMQVGRTCEAVVAVVRCVMGVTDALLRALRGVYAACGSRRQSKSRGWRWVWQATAARHRDCVRAPAGGFREQRRYRGSVEHQRFG